MSNVVAANNTPLRATTTNNNQTSELIGREYHHHQQALANNSSGRNRDNKRGELRQLDFKRSFVEGNQVRRDEETGSGSLMLVGNLNSSSVIVGVRGRGCDHGCLCTESQPIPQVGEQKFDRIISRSTPVAIVVNHNNKGIKRPKQIDGEQQPAVIVVAHHQRSSGCNSNEVVEEEEEDSEEEEGEGEEIDFDYEPVLSKILNEKKLALCNLPDVVTFLRNLRSLETHEIQE